MTSDSLDALGRRTQMRDEANVSTDYGYDELGRLISVTDAASNITRYSYDEAGNKLTQTDAEGRTTTWAYDALGRPISRTLPLGQQETYGYDANSNRTTHTDFNGETHTFTYDALNRMTRANYADGSITSYTYDALGNRTQSKIVDNNGTRTWQYTYDNRNRLAQETKPNGSTLAYQYDGAGNKTQLTTTLANGKTDTISYTYDALNRLATVTNSEGTSTYGYDEVGNRTSLSYPNGASQTWAYDARNRLTKTTIFNGFGVAVQSFDYTLHPTGRRTKITELDGRTSDYTYNNRYWLTEESITDTTNGNYTANYTYDAVGNRTQGTEAGITTAYQYDANDRITQQGGITYAYDDNGNTLSENDQGTLITYSYNSQNQLVEHTANGVNTNYQYNADGIRHGQSNSIASTDYLVDANRSYAQVLSESVNGNQVVSYHFGDDLISQSRAQASHYFHTDGLGSTRVLTDETGSPSDNYAYAAFGEVLTETGATDNSYLYTGEQYDEGLGQYYLRARYYDLGVGRFSQRDEWRGRLNQPLTANKYLYGNSDPILNTDPTGYFSLASQGSTLTSISNLANIASNSYEFFTLATGEKELTARDVGTSVLVSLLGGAAAKSIIKKLAKKADDIPESVNLANSQRTFHILYGEGRGRGGHMLTLRTILNGKSKFPAHWRGNRIMNAVSDVATNPKYEWVQQTGSNGSMYTKAGDPAKFVVEGFSDGINIRVIVEPAGRGIVTAFPR